MLFMRILLAAALAAFSGASLFAAQLTVSAQLSVAAKGKKDVAQIYKGNLDGFDGHILKFSIPGQQTMQEKSFSAESTSIEIILGGDGQAPIEEGPIKTSYTEPIAVPGRIASSTGTATKDTDLQRANLEETTSMLQKLQNQIPIDLTSCHSRGKDSVVTAVGFTTQIVTGKIVRISNGVLVIEKSPQHQQTFNLSEGVISIKIGSCD